MLMNKNDFESGLMQDIQEIQSASFKPPGAQSLGLNVPVMNAGKAGIFGPPQNIGGGFGGGFGIVDQPGAYGAPSQGGELSGKSKRDLLWEQKRKQKLDIINPLPPKMQADNMSTISDQMKPKPPPSLMNQQFQKAVSFEQPLQILEVPAQGSQLVKNSPRSDIHQQQPLSQAAIGFGGAPIPSHQQVNMGLPPPVQMGRRELPPPASNGIWDQVQSNQPIIQLGQQLNQVIDQGYSSMPRNQGYNQDYSSQQAYSQMQQQPYMPTQQQLPQYQNQIDPPRINSVSAISQNQYNPQLHAPPVYPPQNQMMINPQMMGFDPYSQGQQQSLQQNYSNAQLQSASMPSGQNQQNQHVVEDKAKKQKDYLMQIQNEIKEKEEKKRREKEDKLRREREELKQQAEYNPFGKGGAGAPLRDASGNIIVNRTKPNDTPQQYQSQQQPVQQPQYQGQYELPQQSYLDIQPPPQQMQMNNDMNLKYNMPYSSHQSNDPVFQQPPAQRGGGGGTGITLGAFQEQEKARQQSQKQELQNVLKQQMEEQKRRKEEEQRKLKEEEMKEELRVKREREKMEEEFRMEEQKKKAKVQEVIQANANLAAQVKSTKTEVGGDQNFMVDKQNRRGATVERENLFGNNNNSKPPEFEIKPQFEGFGQPAGQPFGFPQQVVAPQFEPIQNQYLYKQEAQQPAGPSSQISSTRIIKDISSELKHNFREEIDKLRQEMNSQQRAFREQLDRLKIEASRQNSNKDEALAEIEKVKAEIKAQRDAERNQDKMLFNALEKYNPVKALNPVDVLQNYNKPGDLPIKSDYASQNNPYNPSRQQQSQPNMNGSFYNSKREGSRQGARDERKKEINNYEKMFFNKQSTDDLRSKPPLPSDRENIPQRNNSYLPMKAVPQQFRESFSGTLMGESELLPLDSNHRSFAPQRGFSGGQSQQQLQGKQYIDNLDKLGAANVRLETESAIDTMDFVNKIVSGKGYQELPSKSNIRPSSNIRKGQQDQRFADKLDSGFDFNFPAIPAYEGIQNLEKVADHSKPPQVSQGYSNYLPKVDSAYGKQFGFAQPSPGERTNTSIGSINSMNLDKLNQRNEDRIAKLGAAFDQLDLTNRSVLTNNHYSPEKRDQNRHPNIPPQPYSGGSNQLYQQNDDLKKMDNMLFDLLRSNEPPSNPYGKAPSATGRTIPHINQNNSYQKLQQMRDSRENFIAPKMGQIYEDGGEDYEGTYKRASQQQMAMRMPTDIKHFDSLLDTTNLALN